MAWCVQDHVVRGFLDNCAYGRICGKVWLAGQPSPITLDLAGNADSSFAGCRIEFTNRAAPVPLPEGSGLAFRQNGAAVDMSCDRKIRVPLVPLEEYLARCEAGEEPPEIIANALHLEWESAVHGLVLIESTRFDVRISLPVWQLLPAPDEDDAPDEEEATEGTFLTFLGEPIPEMFEGCPRWPESVRGWDEFDYERFLQAHEASRDRLEEWLDAIDNSPEVWDQVEEEMGWETSSQEAGPEGFEEDDDDDLDLGGEELLELPEPHLEGVEWVWSGGSIRHPLAHRGAEWAQNAVRDAAAVTPGDHLPAPEVVEWRDRAVELGAHLEGALNHRAYGPGQGDPALVIALLKRSAAMLDGLIGATLVLGEQAIFPEAFAAAHRDELFGIREDVLDFIQRLRVC